MSFPSSTASHKTSLKPATSPNPRLTPCPAKGCTLWAASLSLTKATKFYSICAKILFLKLQFQQKNHLQGQPLNIWSAQTASIFPFFRTNLSSSFIIFNFHSPSLALKKEGRPLAVYQSPSPPPPLEYSSLHLCSSLGTPVSLLFFFKVDGVAGALAWWQPPDARGVNPRRKITDGSQSQWK